MHNNPIEDMPCSIGWLREEAERVRQAISIGTVGLIKLVGPDRILDMIEDIKLKGLAQSILTGSSKDMLLSYLIMHGSAGLIDSMADKLDGLSQSIKNDGPSDNTNNKGQWN